MSYETEHVRGVDNSIAPITGVPTFTELLTNPDLATLYTAIRHSPAITAPELVDLSTISKKTVYEYLGKLAQAGLITEIEDESNPKRYEAEKFELQLTIRGMEVSITPELVAVVAHATEYPVIARVRDEHGLVTFALAHDMIKSHSVGDITVRQIASLTDLSHGTTYDLLEALYDIHDLGDDSDPTTYTPDDVVDEDDDLLTER
ncbi:helix-turn-helix domain-containing protein [Halorubrum tibetense]|uniref:Helix-turn-helix domain-containing protein n=1 Tax=Halorubrum tibetense TaxID=175631 RepID=A0ABD5SIR6_9EURY